MEYGLPPYRLNILQSVSPLKTKTRIIKRDLLTIRIHHDISIQRPIVLSDPITIRDLREVHPIRTCGCEYVIIEFPR